MPQVNVLPDYRATYPYDAPAQKPGGIAGTVSKATSAAAWAATAGGTVTLTVAAAQEYVGTVVPITVSGFLPAGYNGSFQGTIASPTTITYPLASNPGAATQQGTVSYPGMNKITVLSTLTGGDVPNKPTYAAGTIQSVESVQAAVAAAEAEAEAAPDKAADEDVVEETSEETSEESEETEEEAPPPHRGRRRR